MQRESSFLDLNIAAGLLENFEVQDGFVTKTLSFNQKSFAASFPLTTSLNVAMRDPFAAWWKSFLDDETNFGPNVDFGSRSSTYIDLFSSVGGLSLGYEQACRSMGVRPIPLLAADIDELALKIHRRNHSTERTVNASVASLVDFQVEGKGDSATFSYEPEVVGELMQSLVGKVNSIIAGPPCQGYSTLNNHSRGDDPRNALYLTVPALAIALKVDHVIIENVPNVVNDKDSVVDSTRRILIDHGYMVSSGVLQAHQLGWPQTRKRFFLVASKKITPIPLTLLSAQFQRAPLSVTWATSDFKVTNEEDAHLMNQSPELSSENQDRVNWLFENEKYELPNHVRPICHQDGHTYPSVYGRMRPELPAPTLTTGFLSPGRGRFVHPTSRRTLTPREAARLQGFPNWFEFMEGDKTKRSDLAKWIGDAVPSFLGYFAALSLAPFFMNLD